MTLDITLNSLYICVKNMDRAIKFYENFFEQPVFKKDKILSIFNIKGFRFCLLTHLGNAPEWSVIKDQFFIDFI